MKREEALSRVLKVVAETFELKPDEIEESSAYVADLEADSLDLVELVMAFEEEFEVSIPEEAVADIKTVAETVDYVLAQAG
ncbi:MAG: acyl carrier protein [Actinomycetia bacterium]|nr:acyl carrier protein [Actinomycetes bacterium]